MHSQSILLNIISTLEIKIHASANFITRIHCHNSDTALFLCNLHETKRQFIAIAAASSLPAKKEH